MADDKHLDRINIAVGITFVGERASTISIGGTFFSVNNASLLAAIRSGHTPETDYDRGIATQTVKSQLKDKMRD